MIRRLNVFLILDWCYLLFRFDVKIAAAVAEETNLPFMTAENKFEALVSHWMSFILLFHNLGFLSFTPGTTSLL